MRPRRRAEVRAARDDQIGAEGLLFNSLEAPAFRKFPALPLLLERAQQFASAIVGVRGATVNDAGFYRPFIQEWGLS